jgi:hypothetical protein
VAAATPVPVEPAARVVPRASVVDQRPREPQATVALEASAATPVPVVPVALGSQVPPESTPVTTALTAATAAQVVGAAKGAMAVAAASQAAMAPWRARMRPAAPVVMVVTQARRVAVAMALPDPPGP